MFSAAYWSWAINNTLVLNGPTLTEKLNGPTQIYILGFDYKPSGFFECFGKWLKALSDNEKNIWQTKLKALTNYRSITLKVIFEETLDGKPILVRM